LIPTPEKGAAVPGGGGLCLVLGAGGFRGLAHVGVLKVLHRVRLPIRSMIGSSIGGLVAAFYAGVGFDPDRIAGSLSRLTPSLLLATGMALREWGPLSRRARYRAQPLLEDLERLKDLRLDHLHFGLERLGLLALDLTTGEEIFSLTGASGPIPLDRAALGGASLPLLFPAVKVTTPERTFRLVDGGLSHSVPVERAFAPPISAEKVLVVDLQVRRGFREREAGRWPRLQAERGRALIRLRPRMDGVGTVFFRRSQGSNLLRRGEEAVTDKVLDRLSG